MAHIDSHTTMLYESEGSSNWSGRSDDSDGSFDEESLALGLTKKQL